MRVKNSVDFYPGSKDGIIFIGPENTDKWPKDSLVDFYAFVHNEAAWWFRVLESCEATVDNLQTHMLHKLRSSTTLFTTPKICYQGKQLKSDVKLTSLNGKVVILCNEIDEDIRLHPGKAWTCLTCMDKAGTFRRGNMKLSEYSKVHKKPTCTLMYKRLLDSNPSFGKNMEKKHYMTPHGCPLASRDKVIEEHKLSLSKLKLSSPSVEKAGDQKPRRALKRSRPEDRKPVESDEDSSTESRNKSPVRRPREDSPSSPEER